MNRHPRGVISWKRSTPPARPRVSTRIATAFIGNVKTAAGEIGSPFGVMPRAMMEGVSSGTLGSVGGGNAGAAGVEADGAGTAGADATVGGAAVGRAGGGGLNAIRQYSNAQPDQITFYKC